MRSKFSLLTSLTSTAAVALSLSSCGKINEMHDATLKAGENTTDLAALTKRMDKTTCTMYRSMRQGSTKVSRDTDFETITKAKGQTEKLTAAAAYLQGFEYQVWAAVCVDELPREIVMEQAVAELLSKSHSLIKDHSSVSATSLSSQTDKAESINAIAASLHRVNALQAGLLVGTNEKVMRPVDLLIEGLKYDQVRNRGEAGEKTPSWAEVVGNYKSEAVYLLRLRANFLMAYAYAIADSDSMGDAPDMAKKIKRIYGADWFSMGWTPNLNPRTATEIRGRMTSALKLALETRKALVDLGIDPMVDKKILKVWKLANFSKFNLEMMEKSAKPDDRAKALAIRELIAARDRLLANGATGSY